MKENSLTAQPIRSTTKIWVVHVIGMEFLRSLLRRRFARAQVATSQNVGCFLKLVHNMEKEESHLEWKASLRTLVIPGFCFSSSTAHRNDAKQQQALFA